MERCDNDRDEAEELINDSLLRETIDGHEWIIYYSYNLDVIQHSDNEDYMIDNFGIDEAGFILKDKGLSGLHSAIAFWALYADRITSYNVCYTKLLRHSRNKKFLVDLCKKLNDKYETDLVSFSVDEIEVYETPTKTEVDSLLKSYP